MAGGESATGISNARYNLVSVLYHSLEGGATYDKYIEDAENEGDQELADFFRQVQQEDAQRAQQAKSLLDQR
jgi:rubrerythrin